MSTATPTPAAETVVAVASSFAGGAVADVSAEVEMASELAAPSATAKALIPVAMPTALSAWVGGAVAAREVVSAGVAAPGAGSTAMSAARLRMCRRKEVIYSAERGAAPAGTGYVLSSSEAWP